MLRFIMERNLLLYVLAAACTAGVVSQIILKLLYARLMRDTKNTGEPAGGFLQQLRQRFQYCTHLNSRVGNVRALVQRSVMEYRFWKLTLHQWRRIGVQCLVVSLLCSFAGTASVMRAGGNILAGNVYLWMGALSIVLTAAAYGIADTGYAEECLEIRLMDYLENSGAINGYAAEDGAFKTEGRTGKGSGLVTSPAIVPVARGRKSKRKARAEIAEQARMQKEKRELKESLAKVKAGEQEAAAERETDKERGAELLRQMDAKEQERIVREVLKEFLS